MLKLLYNIDPEWLMDDSQEDLSKRFFDKQEPDDANLVSAITEKSKKLNTSYKKYLLRTIVELISLQENEKSKEK